MFISNYGLWRAFDRWTFQMTLRETRKLGITNYFKIMMKNYEAIIFKF